MTLLDDRRQAVASNYGNRNIIAAKRNLAQIARALGFARGKMKGQTLYLFFDREEEQDKL